MKLKRVLSCVGVSLVGGALAANAMTSTAEASQQRQWWWGSPKPTAAVTYYDGSNQLCLWDMKKDGHSVLIKWHFVGAPTHELWNHNGDSAKFVCHVFKKSNENKTIDFRVCTGEFAAAPANRRVITCSAQHSFWI